MKSTRLRMLGSVGLGLALVVWTAEGSQAGEQRRSTGRHIQLKEFDMRRSIEIQVLGDTEIRIPKPPPQVDAAGKPKKYTERELRELKGKARLPGYEGAFANLKLGQTVKVYVSLRKLSKNGKNSGGKTNTDPEEKASWKRLGYLTGIVVMIDNDDGIGKKRRKKKSDDLFSPDAAARFSVQVESVLLSTSRGNGSQTASSKRPATLGKNVFATRVVILRDVKAEDDDK